MSRTMDAMATKKGKKKTTKKGNIPATKRRSAPRSVKTTSRGPKRATRSRPAPRKPAPRKAAARKAGVRESSPRKPAGGRKAVALKPTERKAPIPKPLARASAAKVRPEPLTGSNASGRTAVRRQSRPGHFDPRYVAGLLEQSLPRANEPRAFIESPRNPRDDLAEELGEEVIQRATTGEDDVEETLNAVVPEEQGGPFVETNAAQEFGLGTDPSNPKGAKREPFPTT